MAVLALAYVGSMLGGAALAGTALAAYGATIGWMAGSLIGSAIFNKGQDIQAGPNLGGSAVMGTAYGQAFPWVFGSPRMAGQVVWASPIRAIPSTQSTGKGGGGSVTTFSHECDLLIAFSENMTEGLAREWLNGELVILGTTIKAGVWQGYTFYPGDADQAPDPTYEAYVGVGRAPAFRGRPTLMVRGLQLGQNKVPGNLTSEFAVGGFDPNTTAWLTQCKELSSPTSIVAEIGDDPTELPGTNVLLDVDPSTPFLGDPSVHGAWQNPSGGISLDTSKSWRLEFIVQFSDGVDNTRDFFQISSDSGATNFLRVGWGFSGVGGVLNGNYTLDGLEPFGGTLVNSATIPTRPNTTDFYQLAVQYDEATKLISLLIGGVVYATLGNGSVQPLANTGKLFFRLGDTGTPLFYHLRAGGGVLRNNLKPEDLIVGHSLPYAVSTERLTLLGVPPGPWYDVPADPDGLMKATEALLLRAGYYESQFDVSGLAGIPLLAYQTGEVAGTRAQLETLRPYGQFECAATDKIYIFKRETTPAGVIDWRDLRASEDPNDQGEPFEITFANEMELPAQIQLTYPNMNADYNEGSVHSDRLVSAQLSTQSVQIAVGMTPDMAKRIVDGMLNDMLASLGRATIKLPRKYAKYRPGQVVTLVDPDGEEWRLRILVKRDSLIIIEWDVTLDDPNVLEGFGETDLGNGPTTEINQLAQTEWQMLALRPLRDSDATTPGAYVAVTPAKEAENDDWPGAVFVRARLPGAFEQVFTTGEACVIGECLTTLGDAQSSGVVQREGKLRVKVRGELESVNYYDFFTDRTLNAAVVGNEPIRFMTATFIETDGMFKVYDLKNFLRGQLAMEDRMTGHGSGERFVLLNGAVRHMANETTDIGAEHEVKAVTLNLLLDEVDEEPFTDDGIMLLPASPVYPIAAPQPGGDIDVTWVRRSRQLARWTSAGVMCPVGETAELYRIKVYDDPDADPVRTATTTTTDWTYEAADIASDGFSPGDPITIKVHQLSETVGEGDATILEAVAP